MSFHTYLSVATPGFASHGKSVATATDPTSRYHEILDEECRKAGVKLSVALSRVRRREVCFVRFRAWRRLRALGYSLPMIARVVGRDDHTTILSGLRRIDEHEARHGAAVNA